MSTKMRIVVIINMRMLFLTGSFMLVKEIIINQTLIWKEFEKLKRMESFSCLKHLKPYQVQNQVFNVRVTGKSV